MGPSVAAHHRAMAEYQRSGIGLIYDDYGYWIADHLDGGESACGSASRQGVGQTHGTARARQVVGNPKGRLTLFRCPTAISRSASTPGQGAAALGRISV
jgi:hypothetical protein